MIGWKLLSLGRPNPKISRLLGKWCHAFFENDYMITTDRNISIKKESVKIHVIFSRIFPGVEENTIQYSKISPLNEFRERESSWESLSTNFDGLQDPCIAQLLHDQIILKIIRLFLCVRLYTSVENMKKVFSVREWIRGLGFTIVQWGVESHFIILINQEESRMRLLNIFLTQFRSPI